jgi:hypothetical protein
MFGKKKEKKKKKIFIISEKKNSRIKKPYFVVVSRECSKLNSENDGGMLKIYGYKIPSL